MSSTCTPMAPSSPRRSRPSQRTRGAGTSPGPARFSVVQRIGMGVAAIGVIAAFAFAPIGAGTVLMATAIGVYTVVVAMRIDLMLRRDHHERFSYTEAELRLVDDISLPTYT